MAPIVKLLTYAAQNVGRLWLAAIMIMPIVANVVMTANPSARPQTSRILESGT